METMYKGIAFSPLTILSENISAAATIIEVDSAASFPDAPNYATISDGENAETITYAAKTATALTGCTRAVEGEARAWSAGDGIARNFTAADHDALIDNINELKSDVDGDVKFSAAQALTAAQQRQAQANIGDVITDDTEKCTVTFTINDDGYLVATLTQI